MANEYQRGYAKGRSTGERKGNETAAAAIAQAERAAVRAEQAEAANGVGHCERCQHWLRGGGGRNSENCAWGHCNAPRGEGTPWGVWMASDDHKTPVITTPRFGCVLFMPNT